MSMMEGPALRAAIEALPVGTVVRLGHTFPETGNFQGSQYLRTRSGLRYIGPGRDDHDATTLYQQIHMCDDFRVDALPIGTLAAAPAYTTVIPPATDRPVCVLVSWLADNPHAASKLEYLDCSRTEAPVWRPAAEAVEYVDPAHPVQVRLTGETN